MKELAEVGKDDKTSGVKAVPVTEGNLRELRGTIEGPVGTCYEGGLFEVDIQIPKQYPFEPPKMKFVTKVWHPNISSQTGAICLVRFCDPGFFWSGKSQVQSLNAPNLTQDITFSFIGHFEGPMEPSAHYQNCAAVASSVDVFPRTRGSTRCASCQDVYFGSKEI